MKSFALSFLGSTVLLTLAAVLPAGTTTIDFEAQGAGRGGDLTGIPDSPLSIGIATFTGGELLNAEVKLNADQTAVYASEGLFGSGETNPLVITFAKPVQHFSVSVLNGDDVRSYTVSDNLANSITKSLASAGSLGAFDFSLPGALTEVEIASANTGAWDFAIDNVTFSPATPTPEPESLLLSGAGVFLLVFARRKLIRARLSRPPMVPWWRLSSGWPIIQKPEWNSLSDWTGISNRQFVSVS
jgi:PEP-CTERM motif